jgi:energy-coupling factor transporter ATP-binding protein EcfA2
MILKTIGYSQYDNTPNEWRLESCSLDKVSLIVGENASGKSKILNIIANLGALLSGTRGPFLSANYTVDFDEDGNRMTYTLCCERGAVVKEILNIGKRRLVSRHEDGTGLLYYQRLKKKLNFHAPPQQVVSVARRDEIQHPFLNALHSWGKAVIAYRFGTDMGRSSFSMPIGATQEQPLTNLIARSPETVVATFIEGRNRFGEKYDKSIIRDMGRIGYKLTDLRVAPPFGLSGLPENLLALHVNEADLSASTSQNEMSQGMFRALSLIILITFAQMAESPACILIDDVGEGLDFGRSASLVNLLIERFQKTNTQLVMATNDRFVMNAVPLDYWSVVVRKGNLSRVLNRQNSNKLFSEFQLKGLNNFDFLGSGYYRMG